MKPWVVALTGGIGSGKTAAADAFAALGVPVVDLDTISRALTTAGGLAMPDIQKAFGAKALTPTGAMDRDYMRSLIFKDRAAKEKLEAILHPLIKRIASEEILRHSGAPYVIVVHPLLAEFPGRFGSFDRVLDIDCDESTQLRRVMERSKLSREAVLEIMASQATRDDRKLLANEVIVNEGTLEDLKAEVANLNAYYTQLALQARKCGERSTR